MICISCAGNGTRQPCTSSPHYLKAGRPADSAVLQGQLTSVPAAPPVLGGWAEVAACTQHHIIIDKTFVLDTAHLTDYCTLCKTSARMHVDATAPHQHIVLAMTNTAAAAEEHWSRAMPTMEVGVLQRREHNLAAAYRHLADRCTGSNRPAAAVAVRLPHAL